MKHVVEVFDRQSEELQESIEIPSAREAELADLMGWKSLEDAIYVYDLNAGQLREIERWTGAHIAETGHIVQLACIA
ncbi:hypothetical protein [Pseudomonas sp. PDM04]|jgi:hypothetical protein|uniref:DUF7683 domain-containing protein n=1 Tax=Pseudomonas sp. PDM04 TaxID=2769296 RepID=UPI001784D588|nr:hypothetical protein [Pseudomonas sp. PDM04]MBD9439431.1 hypothetical protein [Pseudomonas sp. PDM04]